MNALTRLITGVQRWSLARQVLALQITVVVIMAVAGTFLASLHIRQMLYDKAAQTTTAVAISVAASPAVLDALDDPDPTAALQPYAERVRREAGLDFITIMNTEGRRYTHPNPRRIGGYFLGHIGPALAGRTFTETYTGTLGPSVRAVTPVRDAGGRIRALVSAGITVEKISAQMRRQLATTALTGAIGLSTGTVGTYLVSTRLRRQTHGLRSAELRRMYEYHQAILHAVREGLLLIDEHGRLTLANDGARELLGLPADAEGRHVTGLGLPPSLTDLLASGETRSDEIHLTGDRVLLVSSAKVRSGARAHGTVVTLRDHTELQALTGQLNAERRFAESLRSAAHEAANRLHTVVALVELGRTEEAVAFATAELKTVQQLTDLVVGAVREPIVAALLLGKSAEAAERGVELTIAPDSELDDVPLPSREVVTILGNLIDNAMEAATQGDDPGRVLVRVRTEDGRFVVQVADSGPGMPPDAVRDAFRRGWTTKGEGRGIGLALVGQAVARLGGTVEVGTAGDLGGALLTVRLPLPDRGTDDDSRGTTAAAPTRAGESGPEGRTGP